MVFSPRPHSPPFPLPVHPEGGGGGGEGAIRSADPTSHQPRLVNTHFSFRRQVAVMDGPDAVGREGIMNGFPMALGFRVQG